MVILLQIENIDADKCGEGIKHPVFPFYIFCVIRNIIIYCDIDTSFSFPIMFFVIVGREDCWG